MVGAACVTANKPSGYGDKKFAVAEGWFEDFSLVERLVFSIAHKVQYEVHYFWTGKYSPLFLHTRGAEMLNGIPNRVDSRHWELSV